VTVPGSYRAGAVEFLAEIENLTLEADRVRKIVINERTGTITAGQDIRIRPVSILHGALTIEIQTAYAVSQPAPLSNGQTTVVPDVKVGVREERAQNVQLREGATVEDLARTLTSLGATARDIIAILQALRSAGASRVTTWLSPTSDELTYLENFRLHVRRLRQVATILADHGCRLGLEYVGPKTSWTARRFPFIHTLREARELIAEIGQPNVGLVLDCWHWYTAGETAADLRTLRAADIISIDLNDAPAGLARDEQRDLERELPLATGVIPLAEFLSTLNGLGCDAPARCEPFNAALRAMPTEQALAATAAAMRRAFALIA
ncbi:MAG: flagellar basal body P-ring protein FlgI, partial [Dehalococcoidia bacterium]|nr:flagellar basal body P-ring protein FlgI [Dehalococcoidia bacterium]